MPCISQTIHVTFLVYCTKSLLTSACGQTMNSLRRRFGTDEASYCTADEWRVELIPRKFCDSLTPLDQVARIQLSVPANVRFESRAGVNTIEHITGLHH
jgi:hypothetical protein